MPIRIIGEGKKRQIIGEAAAPSGPDYEALYHKTRKANTGLKIQLIHYEDENERLKKEIIHFARLAADLEALPNLHMIEAAAAETRAMHLEEENRKLLKQLEGR